MGFSLLDYAVLVIYLIGITLFGARFRGSQRTVKDYFIGAKNTSWVVISLSIVATETSTLTLIGVPALAYSTFARPEQGGSLCYLQVVLGYIVARIIISLLFIPAYFHGELLTAYELLRRRFGASTRNFAASLFLVMRALAEGVRIRVRARLPEEEGALREAGGGAARGKEVSDVEVPEQAPPCVDQG